VAKVAVKAGMIYPEGYVLKVLQKEKEGHDISLVKII